MLNHRLFNPFVVSVLLSCAAEKIVAQSIPIELITTKDVKPHNLPRVQRSVEKPILENRYRFSYGDDPALASAVKQYAQTGKAPHILTDGFVRFAYNPAQSPIVNTAPFQETVIHLEVGEKYTNISSGDPNRWSYAVAISGQGKTQQQHVLVKPSLPQISTNLVITTDKRLYHLQLVSAPEQPVTRAVSFWYPQTFLQEPAEKLYEGNHKNLMRGQDSIERQPINFDYQISKIGLFGAAPSWWPKQVFDDGVQSYVVFPETVNQRDLPVLFILENGQRESVNYRFKDNHFIVDKIFEKALLVSGVGRTEVGVLIRHAGY